MVSPSTYFIYLTLVLPYFVFGLPQSQSASNSDFSCSATKGCKIGCCSKTGVCGLGPTFCASDKCQSSCNYKSECDPGWGSQWSNATVCPLKVCCSKFGFCGTTSDFCGDKTVTQPSCGGTSSDKRTIGYYEGWNLERKCDTMKPEDIPLGYYTHINFAFGSIDAKSFQIAPMASDVAALYSGVTGLKDRQPGLQVWISIGGWAFSDPGATQSTFSDLAGSSSAQDAFFASLISFMSQNSFDGIDLDWEYPVAPERAGKKEDYKNYVSFLQALRSALDASGRKFGLSITIPSSYWYMRNFDIVSIDPIIDWFNIMTYDLHGTWDASDPFIGSVVLAHTNLTEIEQSLDLLWRNHIDPAKVVMGLGFYGRSFTLKDPSCQGAGCAFSKGGKAGPCTVTEGILSYGEIQDVIKAGAKVTTDDKAAIKIVTWDNDQWVSYDDTDTLGAKIKYANQKCLGGTMAWAIDLDRDGLAIGKLGKNLNRKKENVNSQSFDSGNMTDLGIGGVLKPGDLNWPPS